MGKIFQVFVTLKALYIEDLYLEPSNESVKKCFSITPSLRLCEPTFLWLQGKHNVSEQKKLSSCS